VTLALAYVDDEGNIHAGADTAIGAEQEIYEAQEDKVFIKGPYLIGFCASGRLGQILRYRANLPELPEDDDDLTGFLVDVIVPRIQEALEENRAVSIGPAALPPKAVILIGCRGRLWSIVNDLTVIEETPIAAIGSGRHHAYGAMHALTASGAEPPARIVELALEAAAAYSPRVRGPFRFVVQRAAKAEAQAAA
jgi:hypothetical protein